MNTGEWLDTWLELYVDPAKLARNTKLCYHRAVKAVPDALRQIDLKDLSALDLRRWLLQVARETPRAAQLDRIMLSRSLRIAAKLGMCSFGIVDPEVLPAIDHEPRKADVLTLDELRTYMAFASRTKVAPVLLLCCCGLRRGEAMGARWQDIDLQSGVLQIRVQRQTTEAIPLKSAASLRSIRLPVEVLRVIRAWPRQSDWICDAGQKVVYTLHARCLAAAGLPPVTLHGLRHTMATIAAMRGEPIKLIQAALGHAHYGLTADLYAAHLPAVADVTARFLSA